MTIIQTLGHGNRRATFSYNGNVKEGVVLNFSGYPQVTADFFKAILNEFQGRRILGGFNIANPPTGSLGEWVAVNSAKLNAVRVYPHQASHIAAILVREGFITSSLEGNKVYLQF